MDALILIVVGAVIFLVVLGVASQLELVDDAMRVLFSLAVAGLCVLGMRRGVGTVEFVLLPYTTLGIAIVVLFLLLGLWWLLRLFGWRSRQRRRGDETRRRSSEESARRRSRDLRNLEEH